LPQLIYNKAFIHDTIYRQPSGFVLNPSFMAAGLNHEVNQGNAKQLNGLS